MAKDESYFAKIRAKISKDEPHDGVPAARGLSALALARIQSAVAAHYGVDPQTFLNRGAKSTSRDVATWLSRYLILCTLWELAPSFGLAHAASLRNLTLRVDRALPESRELQQAIAAIRRDLVKTERS